MATSLLHRFKFDGVEYQKNIKATDNVIPFSGTGSQRTKHRLIEEIISGNANALPVHILTQVERCILHQTISNTIIKDDYIHTENKSCNRIDQTERIRGKIMFADQWDCPRQQGVILTPYGTITPGAIIGAIAASLQHQNVAVNQLIADLVESSSSANVATTQNPKYNEEEIDFVVPKTQMLQEPFMWFHTLQISNVKLDNIWLATVAGDLAEVVAYQGPVLGSNISLGATGFWNSTIRPTMYYLTSTNENFDATRAELIGGIDGMIIASNLQTWIQSFYSLRLSQILDMYYSFEGVAFNTNIKACNRAQSFLHAVPKTILKEQTYAIAQLLAYRKSIAYISPEALQRMVDNTVEKFYSYAEKYLFPELPCYQHINQPQVEALIVFDGAWSIEYTIDFLAVLIQDLDISMYGSKMGIIHGTSGDWLLNVTNSPSLAFQTLNNFTNISWPTKLNYTRVLETIFVYLNETWENNEKHNIIGSLGKVVVLLIPLSYMSIDDKESSITLLQKMKYHHPDVYFVYYTSPYNSNLFKSFIISDEDHLISNSNIDAITQYLSTIPRILRPPISLETSNFKYFTPQFEDYVSPSKYVTYRLHSHWKRNIKKMVTTIHSFGYGAMKICLWTQTKPNERQNYNCTELVGHKEIILSDNFVCPDTPTCSHTYIRIQNISSLNKCAEIECKTPDQVRFITRISDLHYGSSASKNTMLFPLIFSFIFITNICVNCI
ncbi:uncharacterized protein LOC143184564 [Calliopsis andreniformis]|uniref:uncharacterized protein LOC143184564 n=1 Tax=Calliopsis andreniformis TaxID=337506 RepID=UPI003FCC6E12